MSKPKQDKPERLYFETYLQVLKNSVGTAMFRNFYLKDADGKTFDGLEDGSNSCAFFVSGLLMIFKKITNVHGLVESTIKDLLESGWTEVKEPKPGDVVVWEAMEFSDGTYEHIGFYVGQDRAISTSWTEKKVVEHDINFGDLHRPIKQVLRQTNW